jgi:GR25 family glycosyltransferase involved in LPS biosynthesis
MKYFLLFLILIVGCGPSEKQTKEIVTDEVVQELKSRKIKKVTQSELNSAGYTLAKKTKQQFLDLTRSNADLTCREIAFRISDSSDFFIKIVSMDTLNPSMSEVEKMLVTSYLYSVSNELPYGENISELNKDTLVYTDIFDDVKRYRCASNDSSFLFLVYLPSRTIINSLN